MAVALSLARRRLLIAVVGVSGVSAIAGCGASDASSSASTRASSKRSSKQSYSASVMPSSINLQAPAVQHAATVCQFPGGR